MAAIHARYDPNFGPGVVDILERLGFFRVFAAPWFIGLLVLLVISIVVCTLDRTPRMWRGVSRLTVQQPDAFFDLRLPDRAHFEAGSLTADDVAEALRARRFKVRRMRAEDGSVEWLNGDRFRYLKMATLLTHLGLILFLLGGAVTAALGFETVVFVGEGQTAPVQPVGTPHNLLVKNISFQAPQRPDGSFIDFRTDLGVYRDGQQVARKTITVNDPLEVDGFVFHQNTFGPSAEVAIRDPDDRLVWSGPVLLAGELAGRPQGFLTVPGSGLGLLLLLQRDAAGTAVLAVNGLGPAPADGSPAILFRTMLGVGAASDPAQTLGYTISWAGPGAFTGMVIKRDPGAPIIWGAFLSLISGLALTFYLPRRRVWAQVTRDGAVRLAMIADRYVDAEREFGLLVDHLSGRAGARGKAPVPG